MATFRTQMTSWPLNRNYESPPLTISLCLLHTRGWRSVLVGAGDNPHLLWCEIAQAAWVFCEAVIRFKRSKL